MQKELDDPEYWKNRSRMKFNTKKYIFVHLGINFFFSVNQKFIIWKSLKKKTCLYMSPTAMYHHDSKTMKKENVILQSII